MFAKTLPFNIYQSESEAATWKQHQENMLWKGLFHIEKVIGEWQFLLKWNGRDESDNTLEPTWHFFHRHAREFFVYAEEQNLKIDLMVYFRSRIP